MRAWRRAAIAASGSQRMVTVTLTGVASADKISYTQMKWGMTVVETGEEYDEPGVVTLEQGTEVSFLAKGYRDTAITLNDSLVAEGTVFGAFYEMTVEQDITVNAAVQYGFAILDITTADYTP